MTRPDNLQATTAGPSTPWLGAGALLAGVGTVLLGPILPHVAAQWHLSDSDSGWLIFAKFVGAFLGGISVPRRLRIGILLGTVLSCVGFSIFGLCTGLATGAAALFLGGIGLGQLIASTNILAGNRYPAHTGSALASLNFFWSLGAVGTGVLVAAFLPRLGLRGLLFSIGAAFMVAAAGGWLQQRQTGARKSSAPVQPGTIARETLLRFALLLFLYGGLETCLTGWLTTYTMRYTTASHLLAGQSGTVLLWAALTAGRALSSVALRYLRESLVQRFGLLLSFIFIAALASAQGAAALSLWSILLGLSLAPFFPATFGILLRRSPSAREAGFVLAVSGLGAAAFPKLMGVISTHTGSLRTAMIVPMALALLLLLASLPRLEEVPPERQAEGEYSEIIAV